jgi:hypothetical protein
MKRRHAPKLMGTAGGLLLLVFPIGNIDSAVPVIKVPGAYPYEAPMRIPAPESSVLPTPAPFPYPEESSSVATAETRNSRASHSHRRLTPKAVREAAFKCNGVPDFFGFLAVIPADVSVFDPKLGTTRAVVKGNRVIRKNVTWLRKRKRDTERD